MLSKSQCIGIKGRCFLVKYPRRGKDLAGLPLFRTEVRLSGA